MRIPQGDLSAEQMEKLAGLKDNFPDAVFRLTFRQNIALAGLTEKEIPKLKEKLGYIFRDGGGLEANTTRDVVACAGASTCNLGLCDSRALARALEKKFSSGEIKTVKGLQININGCPNACGHHPQAPLGFVGAAGRKDGRALPFYKVVCGGRKGEKDSAISEEMGIIPARRVPDLLKDFISAVDDTKDFYLFLASEGREILKELIKKYAAVPSFNEDRSFYRDWGKEVDFSLSGIGPGECGAGVMDMIESDLREARACVANKKNKEAIYYSARALLIVKGIEAGTPEDAFSGFEKEFTGRGIASKRFSGIGRRYAVSDDGQLTSLAAEFYEEVAGLYKNMDNNFRFPGETGDGAPEKKEMKTLDLSGVACPMNYVKAKLFMETLDKGERVKIILDEGEPFRNVPESLKNDGNKIISTDKKGAQYELEVEK